MSTALDIPLRKEYLPLAASFTELSAKIYGGGAQVEYSLALAAEEIFVSLCELPLEDEALRLETRDGRYFVELRLTFRAGKLGLGAFNLTSAPKLNNSASLKGMGLYLAARSVDALRLALHDDRTVSLAVVKEKEYPKTSGAPNCPTVKGTARVKAPGSEEVKLFAAMAAGHFEASAIPDFLHYPGKTADMVIEGDLRTALVVCENGAIAGGVMWRNAGVKTIEMIGPFVFPAEHETQTFDELIEHCISQVARTPAAGIFRRLGPAPLPKRHFDVLGSTTGSTFYYRHLSDDEGSTVYCDPAAEAFLRAEYDRLVMPREIRVVRNFGEKMEERSALSCEFATASSQVTLRALCAGSDATEVVAAHVAHLKSQGIRNLFFEMDLAHAWESGFTPALLAAGIVPAVLIPNGGDGDLLIFWKAV